MMSDMNMMTGGMLRNMGMGGPMFGGLMVPSPFGAITDGSGQQPSRRRQELEMNPFAPFGGLLGGLGGMVREKKCSFVKKSEKMSLFREKSIFFLKILKNFF